MCTATTSSLVGTSSRLRLLLEDSSPRNAFRLVPPRYQPIFFCAERRVARRSPPFLRWEPRWVWQGDKTPDIKRIRKFLKNPRKISATAATIPPTIMSGQKPNPEREAAAAIDWDQALGEHGSWLRAVIANRLSASGSRQHVVDEVMQEVALAAVKSPSGSIPPEKVGPWLYKVAVRQTLLYRRKTGRRRKLVERVANRQTSAAASNHGQGDPLSWLLAVERAEQIRLVMDGLHRRDREILMLKYEQGWTYHQLVEHLGISESAVEARLHRARKRLREALLKQRLVEQSTK